MPLKKFLKCCWRDVGIVVKIYASFPRQYQRYQQLANNQCLLGNAQNEVVESSSFTQSVVM